MWFFPTASPSIATVQYVCAHALSQPALLPCTASLYLARQIQPLHRPRRLRQIVAPKADLAAVLAAPGEVGAEDARGELVPREEALEERRRVHAADAAEREPEQAAARVVHKVLRLGAHGDELLRVDAQRAQCDGVGGDRACDTARALSVCQKRCGKNLESVRADIGNARALAGIVVR